MNCTRSRPRSAGRFLAAALLACGIGAASAASTATGDAPRALVDKLSSAVLGVLGDNSLSAESKRQKLEQLVYANVDFDTLSRLVLARNWSTFSPAQQDEFVREFKRHLSLTYGKNVESYKNEKIAITGDHEEARGDWTVQTRILRGGPADISVNYRLRQTPGGWRIIDFVIENVSLVANYRAQFQDILGSGKPEKLLALLRDKNERGEPLKAPGA
jgi:phospholipid transport system substrate-binding protein